MNKTFYIFIFIFAFTVTKVSAQDTDTLITSTSDRLHGTWYLVKNIETCDTLYFTKSYVSPMGWGPRIEILKTGKLIDAYSSKCGNDGQIHNDQGVWTYNAQSNLLNTSIPIVNRGTIFKLEMLTIEKLTLIISTEK